jgi:hypothetical protein
MNALMPARPISGGSSPGLTMKRARKSGSLMIAVNSRLRLATISGGVPAGARSPAHDVARSGGRPASAKVGTLGSDGLRLSEPRVASAVSSPASICGLSVPDVSNGTDLRREPIEVRKATLASILRKALHGVRLNEHLEHPEGDIVFRTPARWAWRGLFRSAWDHATGLGGRRIGSNSRTRRRRP